jgi:hypothetical protein
LYNNIQIKSDLDVNHYEATITQSNIDWNGYCYLTTILSNAGIIGVYPIGVKLTSELGSYDVSHQGYSMRVFKELGTTPKTFGLAQPNDTFSFKVMIYYRTSIL